MYEAAHKPANARIAQASHVLAGALILLKSSVLGEHHSALGVLMLALGVLFIVVALFHHRLEHRPLLTERMLFVLESFAMIIVAAEMVAEHKKYLPYPYALAALIYLTMACVLPRLRRDTAHP